MKERPKLPPIFMRREDEPDYEPEIWLPNWKCFCCEDTGQARRAAEMFIEGYDWNKHKLPVCQNPDCEAGAKLGAAPSLQASLDWRLDAQMCREADQVRRELWRQEVKRQQQQGRPRVEIDLSQVGFNLRGRRRTPEEEMLAQQKHQAVLAEMNALPSG